MQPDGHKHDEDKPRWDLLPFAAAEAVVGVLTFGAQKYAPGLTPGRLPGRAADMLADTGVPFILRLGPSRR